MKDIPCIRIGHLNIIDHLILGIARQRSDEDRLSEPIRATLDTRASNSWNRVCDELTTNAVDGAFITIPLAMDLFAAGLDIRMLMLTHRSGSMIVKKNSSHLKTIADFKNKTVLVPSMLSVQAMLLHRLLSGAGLQPGEPGQDGTDVILETVSPFMMPEMLAADTDDDIAGFAVAEPYGSQAILNGTAVKACTSDDLWKDHPCCVFVLKNTLIREHPEAVQDLVSLFCDTGRVLEDRQNKGVGSFTRIFPDQTEAVIRHVMEETAVRFSPDLLIPEAGTLNIIQSYMADTMGVLKNKINPEQIIETRFILNWLAEKSL